MQEYMNFFMNHWGLSLIFVAAFVWVIIVEAKSRAANGLGVSASKAVELINKEKAKVFDIRSEENFKSGHIVDAKNINADKLKSNVEGLKFKKDQAMIVACMRGISAQAVVKELRKQGYAKAYVLTGGMNAWQQAELPVVKS